MHELAPENTVPYLHQAGWLPSDVEARVEALAWGVSNVVLRVSPDRGEDLVIKQSRERLRTKDPWFSRLDRIWREADAMRLLAPRLPARFVPRVLFEDRENYLFAMEAAPVDHVVWKQRLLEGVPDASVASYLGQCLGTLHRETAGDDDVRGRFGDTEVFVQLRVDPFYRRIAVAAPEVAPAVDAMISEMWSTASCLVHADFSPKNVLICHDRIVLVDYETAHYGDPAFDLGFFLSHLLLKGVKHKSRFGDYAALTADFWAPYLNAIAPLSGLAEFAPGAVLRRTFAHLAGCMWARIDGTSKVDYLSSANDQATVRQFSRDLLLEPPADWAMALNRLDRQLAARS